MVPLPDAGNSHRISIKNYNPFISPFPTQSPNKTKTRRAGSKERKHRGRALMVAAATANLSRTGGLRLLSSCTRPLLLSTSTSHSNSNSNSPFLNPNYYNSKSHKFSLTNASLSFSSSPKSTTRVYCTTSPNVAAAEDSSSSAPSSSDIGDESVKTTIKDVANTLEIKVGQIIKAWRHEEADSLYVEEVDVGEAEPRIICSGLVKYMPLDHLQVFIAAL